MADFARDQVWTSDGGATWAAIDTGVSTEVGSVRVAQKVFPTTPMLGAQSVPADRFDPRNMSIEEGQMKPVLELSVEFLMRQSQVDNEATLGVGQKLSRLAAKSVALVEDLLLFQGRHAELPPNVRVMNRAAAEAGLVFTAANALQVDRSDDDYPSSIFRAVARGISTLGRLGQPGPYALILESSVLADMYSPEPTSLVTPADRVLPLVPAGCYSTGALFITRNGITGDRIGDEDAENGPPGLRCGLLASLGGEPTSLYLVQDAVTAFTQADPEGVLRFRVFERIQYVVRDPSSLLRFEFT